MTAPSRISGDGGIGNTLYLECYSGISGDMTVAALLDLGADQDRLRAALDSMSIEGFRVEIKRIEKKGIAACDFDVIIDHAAKHAHEHRGLREITEIIEAAEITPRAKATAERIFSVLAKAESEVHGVDIQEVHFHEVGAVDSIVDIVSAAVCLDDLDVQEVIVSELYDGKGFVRCQHGLLPVPVPAVRNIAAAYGLRMKIMDAQGEHVTPTGAAIVAAIRTQDHLPEHFRAVRIGIGAGKRETDAPGILRAMIIEPGGSEVSNQNGKTGAYAP